jgi:arginine N-succinyltransferase
MLVMRPAQLADLAQIERLAQASGPMVCTLPVSHDHLLHKIRHSLASLRAEVELPGEESYFFVLEESQSGQLLGTAAIIAQAGYREPFYAYRNDVVIHSSRALKVHNRLHALTLAHDLTDHSQLCSFYLAPEWRQGYWPQLLSLGRLLFIAQHPARFSPDLAAVLPGVVDEQGRSPFWEQVGRKFFGIDYNQVEHYHGTRDKTFIAELMPHHPLYVSLLAEEALAVMGQVHPDASLQFELLVDDGFEADDYIEIFDAGPVITARRTVLQSWQQSRVSPLARIDALPVAETQPLREHYLLINSQLENFRALVAKLPDPQQEPLVLSPAQARGLGVQIGDAVRWLPLPEQ